MGTGGIGLTQVQCDEDDNHILRCSAMGIGTITSTTCDHTQDVGINCCKHIALCISELKATFVTKFGPCTVQLNLKFTHACGYTHAHTRFAHVKVYNVEYTYAFEKYICTVSKYIFN